MDNAAALPTAPTFAHKLHSLPPPALKSLKTETAGFYRGDKYSDAGGRSIVGVDPALRMHRLALRRIRESGLSVELIGLSAETLVAEDASFDTVVSTYTLCTIPDPLSALREMRRVLVPGGKLLFSEHGLAPDPEVRAWQRRLQPWWGRVSGGCRLDRDIPALLALLAQAGFKPDVQQRYIPGPRFVSYHYWGEAVAA